MNTAHAPLMEASGERLLGKDRHDSRIETTKVNTAGKKPVFVVLTLLLVLGMSDRRARAHCDAESGPVAVDARAALESGQFERAAIWVGPEQHEELRSAFDLAVTVYKTGGKAGQLAERYFVETAVRLHRQAEGFPYTGLKPSQPLPPDVAAAERALETGDLQPVSNLLASEIQKTLRRVFATAREAQKTKDNSLAAGREWADAYVKYVTYVHGLYETIQEGPSHGLGE